MKDKKWYPQTDITPFCKPCAQYNGYHFGVDTNALCEAMGAALGVPPAKRGAVLACLFNFKVS